VPRRIPQTPADYDRTRIIERPRNAGRGSRSTEVARLRGRPRKARASRRPAGEAAGAEELNAESRAELGPDEEQRAVRPPPEDASVQAEPEARPDEF
jgi:hypothetical protein